MKLETMTIEDAIETDEGICRDCAEGAGAEWPRGHLGATCWSGACAVCAKETGLCAASDWNWPRAPKETQKWVAQRREF